MDNEKTNFVYRVEVTRMRKMYAMYGGKGNSDMNCGSEVVASFVTRHGPDVFGLNGWRWTRSQTGDSAMEFRRTVREKSSYMVGVERESVYAVTFHRQDTACKEPASGPRDVDIEAIVAADEWTARPSALSC